MAGKRRDAVALGFTRLLCWRALKAQLLSRDGPSGTTANPARTTQFSTNSDKAVSQVVMSGRNGDPTPGH
jgi:hypothetical protein